jgi:hypothetical protein
MKRQVSRVWLAGLVLAAIGLNAQAEQPWRDLP